MNHLQKLKSIDQFGVIFTFFIHGHKEDKYKSYFGAISTLVLNSIAIMYFFYILILWCTDQIPPKVIEQIVFDRDGTNYNLTESPFLFNVEAYGTEEAIKLNGTKIYDIAYDFYYDQEYHSKFEQAPNCSFAYGHITWDLYVPVCVDLYDPSIHYQSFFTQNFNNRSFDKFLGYSLMPCNTDGNNYKIILVRQDPTCIGEEIVNDILELNEGRLTTYEQVYNYQSGEIFKIPRDFYFPLSTEIKLTLYMTLMITRITVVRGSIFPTSTTSEFISQIKISTWPSSRKQKSAYAQFWVSLERGENIMTVEYPRLPEIMAQVSTILSGLISIGIIIAFVNNFFMRKEILKNLKEIYFFNSQELTHTKISSVLPENHNNKLLHSEIEKQLLAKCNFFNIIYEISKIQLALSALLKKEQLIEIQKMKYRICNVQNETESILSEENFALFSSLNQIKTLQEIITLEENQIQDFNFYQRVNMIISLNQPYREPKDENFQKSDYCQSNQNIDLQSPKRQDSMLR